MVQTVAMEDLAREIHDFKARKKFKSNGDGHSRNETKLRGQLVVFRAGKQKNGTVEIRAIGRLQMISAATRGAKTLGITWKTHNRDGRVVKRNEVVWAFRDQQEFTIEPFIVENPRADEVAWIEKRDVILPTVEQFDILTAPMRAAGIDFDNLVGGDAQ